MPVETIYNYLELSDSVGTGGQPTEAEISALAERGFELVVNLGLEGASYALQGEEALVHAQGMAYIHLPVIWERPAATNLEAFINVMEVNAGKKVFVHCAANMRVSVFMALYRIKKLGWPIEDAFEDVSRIWTPNAVWAGFISKVLEE